MTQIPTKLDLLGTVNGLLNIEDIFGIKLEAFDALKIDDVSFMRCAEQYIPQKTESGEDGKLKQLCKMSLNNNNDISMKSENDHFHGRRRHLKCRNSNYFLFNFKVEDLFRPQQEDEDDEGQQQEVDVQQQLGIQFVHDFLSESEIGEFKTFREKIDFYHMKKFYDFVDQEQTQSHPNKVRQYFGQPHLTTFEKKSYV